MAVVLDFMRNLNPFSGIEIQFFNPTSAHGSQKTSSLLEKRIRKEKLPKNEYYLYGRMKADETLERREMFNVLSKKSEVKPRRTHYRLLLEQQLAFDFPDIAWKYREETIENFAGEIFIHDSDLVDRNIGAHFLSFLGNNIHRVIERRCEAESSL